MSKRLLTAIEKLKTRQEKLDKIEKIIDVYKQGRLRIMFSGEGEKGYVSYSIEIDEDPKIFTILEAIKKENKDDLRRLKKILSNLLKEEENDNT